MKKLLWLPLLLVTMACPTTSLEQNARDAICLTGRSGVSSSSPASGMSQ